MCSVTCRVWLCAFFDIFFYCWAGDHRYLHSFPTRRSSDLLLAACASIRLTQPLPTGGRDGNVSALHGLRRRSEEHTSELQSLTNLVCRLLLEKKNDGPNEQDRDEDDDELVEQAGLLEAEVE